MFAWAAELDRFPHLQLVDETTTFQVPSQPENNQQDRWSESSLFILYNPHSKDSKAKARKRPNVGNKFSFEPQESAIKIGVGHQDLNTSQPCKLDSGYTHPKKKYHVNSCYISVHHFLGYIVLPSGKRTVCHGKSPFS